MDRNVDVWAVYCFSIGRSLRGNVDRNKKYYVIERGTRSRSLRGNVDRNQDYMNTLQEHWVVPYVGTWIEIPARERRDGQLTVVPYVGTWIEMGCPHHH